MQQQQNLTSQFAFTRYTIGTKCECIYCAVNNKAIPIIREIIIDILQRVEKDKVHTW